MRTTHIFMLMWLLAVSHSTARAATISYRTIALEGDVAPQTGGAVFLDLDRPNAVVNDKGLVAFHARILADGASYHTLWREQSGTLQLVAQQGEPAPGATGADYHSFLNTQLGSSGEVAFRALLVGGGVEASNNQGVWSDSLGNLQLIARTGNPAPDSGGATFSSFDTLAANEVGQVAFRGHLSGAGVDGSNDRGIWSNAGAGLQLVARTGSPAPATGGAAFSHVSPFPALNEAGQLAFFGQLAGSSVDHGVWVGEGNALRLVARTDSLAPDANGAVFSGLGRPALNGAGQTAFSASLSGSGVDGSNRDGIWSEGGGGTLQLVARTGSPAAGVAGAEFSRLGQPVLDASGQVVLFGEVAGSQVDPLRRWGLWRQQGTTLQLVAGVDTPAPGTVGAFFSSFDEGIGSGPLVNKVGQVAFVGRLLGDGVDNSNNQGIWAQDGTGELTLIARKGDLLEVAPEDHRMVNFLELLTNSGNEDGRRSGFSDSGQLVFAAGFADGSNGIFVASLPSGIPVPEPKPVHSFLGLLVLLIVLWRRWTSR